MKTWQISLFSQKKKKNTAPPGKKNKTHTINMNPKKKKKLSPPFLSHLYNLAILDSLIYFDLNFFFFILFQKKKRKISLPRQKIQKINQKQEPKIKF